MIPGSAHELSEHDQMILDLEASDPTETLRRALCERIGLPPGRYQDVLEGLADTEAAYAYAPSTVRQVRRLRYERFTFERRNRRWKHLGV